MVSCYNPLQTKSAIEGQAASLDPGVFLERKFPYSGQPFKRENSDVY